MKNINLVCILAFVILLCACEHTNNIGFNAIAEEIDDSITFLKWEYDKSTDCKLVIRAASSRDELNKGRIIATTTMKKKQVRIKRDHNLPRQQFYQFEWGYNNKFVISTQRYYFEKSKNLRDIGGYSTIDGNKTRWGILYRGDCTEGIPMEALKELGIRTVIDMRTPAERSVTNDTVYKGVKIINLVFCPQIIYDYYYNRALAGDIVTDSMPQAILKIHVAILETKIDELKTVFNILNDSANYPCLITCTSSKFIVVLLTAYILNILNVEYEYIAYDYELSNKYIRVPSNIFNYNLSTDGQEAISKFYSSDKINLDLLDNYMKSKYGSIEEYLHKRIGLTCQQLEQLRKKLLRARDQ